MDLKVDGNVRRHVVSWTRGKPSSCDIDVCVSDTTDDEDRLRLIQPLWGGSCVLPTFLPHSLFSHHIFFDTTGCAYLFSVTTHMYFTVNKKLQQKRDRYYSFRVSAV